MPMTRRKRIQEADRLIGMANDFLQMGFYSDAAHYYRRSIQHFPTAEAYTYLAWSLSFEGEYQRAIEFCKVAIGLDPEFGSPYNDIGAYLLELGRADEAIGYLRRATHSRRNDSPQFAHFNLGRAWEHKHDYDRATRSYRRALDYDPDYQPARMAYYRLVRMGN